MTSEHDPAIIVAALYRFAHLPDPARQRGPLLDVCRQASVYGSLLLAPEGINGTIAGPRSGIDTVLASIRDIPGFAELEWKESRASRQPFKRMKVRLKKEIVTMGVPGVDPNRSVGTYVPPKDWNKLIQQPDVVVIDTRNAYEVAIGTFEGAIDPATAHFRDFPAWAGKHLAGENRPRIAMFCTGGIRCEKATAYLKEQGYDEVYHLQGGILKYLEEVPPAESLWRGECFVFDERVSVGHGLEPGPYQLCSSCRMPIKTGAQGGGYADEFCDTCKNDQDVRRRQAKEERLRQIDLAESRGEVHIGDRSRRGPGTAGSPG